MILQEALSKNLFHFTTIQAAHQMMDTNVIYMSQTTPNNIDARLSHKNLFYFSTTRNGNILTSEYPKQRNTISSGYNKLLVRFCLDGDAFKENGFFGKPVSFFQELLKDISNIKTDSQKKSDIIKNGILSKLGIDPNGMSKRDLQAKIKSFDTEEDRITSNSPTIPNFKNYVTSVDILVDSGYDEKINSVVVAKYFSDLNSSWCSLLRFYNNVENFNNFGEYHNIDDIIDNSNNDDTELTLNSDDFEKLKKNGETRITPNGLNGLATAIYILYYSSNGVESIKDVARRKMQSYGLNCDILLTMDGRNKKNTQTKQINLMDGVVSLFDDIAGKFENMNPTQMPSNMQMVFRTFVTYANQCKFVNVSLLQMYSDWLSRYKKYIKQKVSDFSDKLSNSSEDLLSEIVLQYIAVFKKILAEYNIQVSDSALSPRKVKNILKMLGRDRFVREFISVYRREFYHYDEICYFKRSVMMYKNRMITSLRSDEKMTRMGDLAVLYNNADDANKKMNR